MHGSHLVDIFVNMVKSNILKLCEIIVFIIYVPGISV